MRHRLALATAFGMLLAGPVPARAATGGLLVRFTGCVRGEVTLTRSVPKEPPFTLTVGGAYASWTLVRPGHEIDDAIGAFLAPKFWAEPVRLTWPDTPTIPSARYRLTACADRPSTLRLALAGYDRWVTPRTYPAGPAQYAVAPVQTGSAEFGEVRKNLKVDDLTMIIVGYFRAGGEGATKARMCFAEVGDPLWEKCLWPPGAGLILGGTTMSGSPSSVGVEFTYHFGPPGQTDAVLQMAGTRQFNGGPTNMFFAAAIPR